MANLLIINGFQPNPVSAGRLNAALVERARRFAKERNAGVSLTQAAGDYDLETEIEAHLAAEVIVFQFPLNSMGAPWSLKKYLDEVYTAGMDGRLSRGDGRSRRDPKRNYGTGGSLAGRKYMLSLTCNAPREAFDAPDEPLFRGAGLDDLLLPLHANARFFGLEPLKTFAMFDVTKNPQIELDFERFEAHLQTEIAPCLSDGRSGRA